jgi:serine/threonine protein kinase
MKKGDIIIYVAVKKYSAKINGSVETTHIKSMRLEESILKEFPHPFIIKYIDSFRDKDENAYLVTEFANYFDLHKHME